MMKQDPRRFYLTRIISADLGLCGYELEAIHDCHATFTTSGEWFSIIEGMDDNSKTKSLDPPNKYTLL